MTPQELRERMRGWLMGEYRAIIFSLESEAVAYALYKGNETEVYLRQLFVSRDRRRQGTGRKAVKILRREVWPKDKRLTVEVLTTDTPAVVFWHSLGYKDYCLTLEIMP
jgi:GNAT superfamily N-acetyltransferase